MSELDIVQTILCNATKSSSTGTWVCCLTEHGNDQHYYLHEK